MQIVGDDHGAELSARKGPGTAVFQIGRDALDVRMRRERTRLAIDRRHRVATLGEEVRMPPAARRDVQDRRAGCYHPAHWTIQDDGIPLASATITPHHLGTRPS